MGKNKEIIGKNLLKLVEKNPDVVHNRNLLIVEYWKQFNGVSSLSEVNNAPSAESIVRSFRHLVSKKEIKIDKSSKKFLKEREEQYRTEYAGPMHVNLNI